MFEHDEKQMTDLGQAPSEQSAEPKKVEAVADELNGDGPRHRDQPEVLAAESASQREANGSVEESGDWRIEAGRKGARRIHELIEHGKLYEREHGLKRGRQRLRQLIEEGKLYEQEHGMTQERRGARDLRPRRLSSAQQMLHFLQLVLRLAKPRFRGQVARLIQLMESEQN
jgi:hypothetical protein